MKGFNTSIIIGSVFVRITTKHARTSPTCLIARSKHFKTTRTSLLLLNVQAMLFDKERLREFVMMAKGMFKEVICFEGEAVEVEAMEQELHVYAEIEQK
ncbi:MAG: hypothetical protein ACK5KR_01360 [Breznakia sp.]